MPLPLALPPADPAFEIVAATTGYSQGSAQTEGIQVKPRATLRIGSVQAGAIWRNIDSDLASGVGAMFMRLSKPVGRLRLEGGIAYRMRTGVKVPHQSGAWEFSAAARRDFGKLSLRANAEFSPREFEKGYNLYVEATPSIAIDSETSLSASLGRRQRNGPDFTALNAGLTRTVVRGLALDLRYFATSRPDLGERYKARLVVAGRLTL